PSSCVAIEDSKNGIKAARAAGLPVLAAPSYYLKEDDFSLATSVLSDLGEPDRPCRQIGGLRFDRDYVDIDGLNAWLSKQQRSLAETPRDPAQIISRSLKSDNHFRFHGSVAKTVRLPCRCHRDRSWLPPAPWAGPASS